MCTRNIYAATERLAHHQKFLFEMCKLLRTRESIYYDAGCDNDSNPLRAPARSLYKFTLLLLLSVYKMLLMV